MSTAKKMKPRFKVGDRVSFLYGPRQVNGEIVEDRGPLGAFGRRMFLVRADVSPEQETAFEIPEDNLEDFSQESVDSASPGRRVEFSVAYTRLGTSRQWRATVKRGRVYPGMKARGAVAYTAARWEGEPLEDEKHGIVTVFLKPPTSDVFLEPSTGDADAWMATEARRLADDMFVRLHPDAQVEK